LKHLYLVLIFVILFCFLLAACSSEVPQVIVITQEVLITQVVTVVVVVTATPEPVQISANEVEVQPEVTDTTGWILPERASDHVGEIVSVRMEQAQCSYRESTNGKPTFCNDKPFPAHNFTFLVWGRDWSAFDESCLIVEGEVEMYDGKAQILVEDETQVQVCP